MGLEGKSWEYLGATVKIDVTDPDNPKIEGKPAKSTFCTDFAGISFTNDTTAVLPSGVSFDLKNINYGAVRPNNLINEGGQYIPKWNDKGTVTSKDSALFTNSSFTDGYYIWVKVSIGDKVHDLVVDYSSDLNG